jgi:hypothetical protein
VTKQPLIIAKEFVPENLIHVHVRGEAEEDTARLPQWHQLEVKLMSEIRSSSLQVPFVEVDLALGGVRLPPSFFVPASQILTASASGNGSTPATCVSSKKATTPKSALDSAISL